MLSFSGKTTPIHNVLAMNVASLRKVSFYKSLKCCICARAFFRAKHLGVVKPPPSQSGFSDRMVPNLNFSLLFVSSMSKGDKVKKNKALHLSDHSLISPILLGEDDKPCGANPYSDCRSMIVMQALQSVIFMNKPLVSREKLITKLFKLSELSN